ncbi:MAG: hypothetical protein ABWZ63_01100 [Thermoleophilaceae bacterium]
MTSSRALLSALALLAALAAVGTAFATPADQESAVARSGGTLAEPVEPVVELRGGGNMAPSTDESAHTAAAGEAADGPRAQAGQAEQPTTPGAEEQSGGEPPVEESAQILAEDPATEELAGPVADTGGGGLPSTGLELAAMAIVGLGLLFLGAALRPRRDVPAHRR